MFLYQPLLPSFMYLILKPNILCFNMSFKSIGVIWRRGWNVNETWLLFRSIYTRIKSHLASGIVSLKSVGLCMEQVIFKVNKCKKVFMKVYTI